MEEGKRHLSQFEPLKEIIQGIELPDLQLSGDVYFDLLESIISQQISIQAARSIFQRFLQLFPDKKTHPELSLQYRPEELRTVGISMQKANYLLNIAHYTQQKYLEKTDWNALNDQEIIDLLIPK
jgi:DNA-3-methyladenine glycosylase II